MKKIFYKILNLGVEDNQSPHDKRRIKVINLVNSVTLFFLLIGVTNYFFLKAVFPLIPELLFMFLASLALYLSSIKKTDASFLLFTLNSNLSIFFINQYYPFDSGSYLFYFPLIVSVILLNNITTKNKFALFHFSTSVLFFAAFLTLDFPNWEVKSLSPETLRIMWYYNMIMSALITALISGLLNRLIAIQNSEILVQNNDLKQAKEEINISLKEKEVLLAELHHRVKNNLAIISGLLTLQGDSTTNHEAKQIINDSKNRIQSMAMVHKMLYNYPELKNIDIGKYSSELIHELLNSYNLGKNVTVTEDYDNIVLPISKSIPLGLILNEIVTNSIKYVFKIYPNENKQFFISIKVHSNVVVLVARDSGNGFPSDLDFQANNPSLGIYLIKSLMEQMDGTVRFSSDKGAKIELNFGLH